MQFRQKSTISLNEEVKRASKVIIFFQKILTLAFKVTKFDEIEDFFNFRAASQYKVEWIFFGSESTLYGRYKFEKKSLSFEFPFFKYWVCRRRRRL